MKPRNPGSELAVRTAANMSNTFNQLAARAGSKEESLLVQNLRQDKDAAVIEEYFRDLHERKVTRVMLACFADSDIYEVFVATVVRRGLRGWNRTILLEDVRVFGVKIVVANHVWVPYGRHWERIEPFFQGCQVVLVGRAVEYARGRDRTMDYTLDLDKVTTLWNHPPKPDAN